MTDDAIARYLEPEKGGVFKREVMIYSRYERFWHWTQAILIFTLLFSGFGVHGTHNLLDYRTAVTVHTYTAIALLVLWMFTTFWNFTTGQWKQYLFKKGIWRVVRFYAFGILRGEPHPYKKSLQRKQNALQSRAYMTFIALFGPALWLTGISYLLYDLWSHYPWAGTALTVTAHLHTAAAFIMAVFVIIHIYMTTTGKTAFHYIRTMITGYEEIELSELEEAYLEQTQTVPMRPSKPIR